MGTNFNPEPNRYEGKPGRHSQRLGLTGPILLIALGVMFLVGQFFPEWGVGKTWPVILIIVGLARLIESSWGRISTSGH